jgi:diguanylate cyclase (GGDEF)-like protein
VGAEKGLLLGKVDRDGDGRLDVITHRGFAHDPAASDLAQRFAERVLERDEIVREDEPSPGSSPADEEIACVVAVPVYMREDFEGVVVCANRAGGFEELEDDVLLALGDHAGAALENARLHGRMRATYVAVVQMLSDSIAAKDPFARAHSGRICGYVDAVAKRLGLEAPERERLAFAVLLHDIGKLGISERVLLKPGPLTQAEWGLVHLHPLIGCRIVERVPGLEPLGPTIRHHHERWDGTGYPSGRAGTDIPLPARIVAVADAFRAMVAGRPYRPSTSPEAACQEIERCAGTQFDPDVAELFVAEVRRRPLDDSDDSPVADALEQPAVRARRRQDEPVLGHGPVGAIDNVTLLLSHRYLLESAAVEAERARRQRRPFAVVMVELADLAATNGREGYAAGDAALHEVARALEQATAETAATVGRYSGRRLVAVLPQTGQQAATAVVERLLSCLDGAHAVRTGISVWQHGDTAEAVLLRARLAMDGAALVGVADVDGADSG